MAVLFLTGLTAAVVWKLYQWAKAPQDRSLRSVALCLTSAALSYPLAMPGGATGFNTVAGHGAAKLVQNLLLLATVYFLMCFYLYAAADERASRHRARLEAVLVVAVGSVITAATVTVPHQALAGSFATTDMTVPQVALFYVLTGVYLMYALVAAGTWTRRYARMSAKPHSTGLWTAGVGMVLMAAACAVRAVIVGIRWGGGSVPGTVVAAVAVVLALSVLLFVFGITYSGVRTRISLCRLWLRRRSEHARLEPLWKLMAEAAPHAVFAVDSGSRRDRWRARGVHRRHHRRVVECRDGLVEISPYLPANSTSERPWHEVSPELVAQHLRDAVRSRKNPSAELAPARPMAAIPGQRSRDADIQQLLVLSDALRSASGCSPQQKESRTPC
ncbi:MAB_1171c family putative transporter [Streptomyces sp. SDT5-1]|uniref:MAB_1171c family putative transporter n=1 Tax=Streptomyces sp. SDT5-1 TaxID=3406418 RepID=UPI003FD27386